MKKLLALFLALTMVLGLAACSGSGTPAGTTAPAASTAGKDTTPADPATSGEVSHIKLELITLMTVPSAEATKTVENDINKYLKETLGISNYVLDLTIISIADFATTIPMELASGSGPDLVMMLGTMGNYVDNGYLIPLNDYLDNELKPTADKIGAVLENGKIGTNVYMIPRYFGTVLDWKFIYNKALVDGKYDMTKVHDMDSLEECLAALKTAYPDEHFLVYADQFPTIYSYAMDVSTVGTYAATVKEDTTLVNFYETDAFKTAIKKAYEFRQKGYLDPEGSANTQTHDAVVMSGSAKGVIMGHSADCEGVAKMFDKMNTYGAEFGAVTIGIGDLYTDNVGIGISFSCKDPKSAANFINLLYTDEFVWDTLIYGSEGQDYVWNEDHTVCSYPDGLDANSIPYNCIYSCGIIGNGFQSLPFENTNTGSSSEYGMQLMQEAWAPPLYGFTPSNANVMNEVAAVSNVVDQYLKPLTFGDVNPDDYYPQFLEALKAAGIDTIIADYQAQANEWLAAK